MNFTVHLFQSTTMIIEQIYTNCLAHGAYYIESDGEAVIIDPLRDIDGYLQRAKKSNARISYILETHFHADFVSGHLDLANATGAQIVYGPTAKPGFDAHIAYDGEILHVGKVQFKVLHTPGHTMESTCYLLFDEVGKEVALFTGDTLFIGDVGRPDLAQKLVPDLTSDKLAGLLYDSLNQKILPLPDDLIVYPAHGAGSACGKNMSKETTDTLGHQRATNYALQPMDKATFIKKVTEGLLPPPNYFPFNVLKNIQGYESLDVIEQRGLKALTPEAFHAAAGEIDALILDTRDPQLFAAGFIPGAINIGINGNFAPWIGTLVKNIDQPILIVAEKGREREVVDRMARVGYDNTIGFLDGGIDAWTRAGKELDHIVSISAWEFADRLKQDNTIHILDVRKATEYAAGHLAGALNMPLDYINDHFHKIGTVETYYVHCAGGYRSMIFTSILRARGYDNLVDVAGGLDAITRLGNVPVAFSTASNLSQPS